jgi:hypothetical protein
MLRTIALLPLILFVGCASKPQPAAAEPPGAPPPGTAAPAASEPAASGIANPASVYCTEQGGTLEMREGPGGTAGYCHLPDGRVVEEWELYRAAHAQP